MPPETMLKGAPLVLAVPLRVPLLVFWTVKVRSAELPIVTLPKSRAGGVTERTGGVGGGGGADPSSWFKSSPVALRTEFNLLRMLKRRPDCGDKN